MVLANKADQIRAEYDGAAHAAEPACPRSSHEKSFMRMFDQSVCPEDLLLLAKADHLGRIGAGAQREILADGYAETERRLRETLALYQGRMSRPYVMGKELMAAGAEPGPLFTDAPTYARKLRLAGVPKEEQLAIDHGHVNFAQAA